ncbi:MAG TPA: hypothetical protein VJ984_09645 [Xanthomonadales bacterium]|nr:hypothetical protein [Xanthomonadales bacterium]
MLPRLFIATLVCFYGPPAVSQETDPQSGLILDENWELVLANCSGCHSPRLVTQNKMNADSWLETIHWMQDKHNLWDLGDSQSKIISYLAKNYGVPELPYRRKPLNVSPLTSEG